MKHLIRLWSLFLLFSLLTGMLTACQDEAVSPTPPANVSSISITDEFVITRGQRASEEEKTADRSIRSALEAIGVKVNVQDDWYQSEADIPKHEILVGKTNRAESAEAVKGLALRDYSISVHGSAEDGYKVVIAASGSKGITAGVAYFISTYLTSAESNQLSTTLSYRYTYTFPCENITIGSNSTPLKEYTIVYAYEGVTSGVDPNYQTYIQSAKYEDVAYELADMLSDIANVSVKVSSQFKADDDGSPKILVGKTDFEDDDFAYQSGFSDVGSYRAELTDNGTVVLAGDNACAVYAAGEAFIDALCDAKTNLSAFSVQDTKQLIKVACIGDSITHGSTSDDENRFNYPAYLQRLLGYDYYVEKYGAPGFSMTSTDTYAYLNHGGLYKPSLNAKADVVIIMLGTNDCNPYDDYKDWTNPKRASTFTSSAKSMVNAYRRANSNAQIYLMTPPTVPQSTAWNDNVKNYAVPLTVEAAETNNCYLIDIYTWSLSNTKVFAADGLHPKNETYGDLAQAVYDGLKDTIRKPE